MSIYVVVCSGILSINEKALFETVFEHLDLNDGPVLKMGLGGCEIVIGAEELWTD